MNSTPSLTAVVAARTASLVTGAAAPSITDVVKSRQKAYVVRVKCRECGADATDGLEIDGVLLCTVCLDAHGIER